MSFEVTKAKRQALVLLSKERYMSSRHHITNVVPELQNKGLCIVPTVIHASVKPVS